jgi:hypothetical protein
MLCPYEIRRAGDAIGSVKSGEFRCICPVLYWLHPQICQFGRQKNRESPKFRANLPAFLAQHFWWYLGLRMWPKLYSKRCQLASF